VRDPLYSFNSLLEPGVENDPRLLPFKESSVMSVLVLVLRE